MVLDGVVVIETAGVHGELCGRLLADAGARVVRVRQGGAAADEPVASDMLDVQDQFRNRGKHDVVIDLASAQGRAELTERLAGADLWLRSHDGGHFADGLPASSEFAPATPSVTVSSMGVHGPRSGQVANDIVLTAVGGLTNIGGSRDYAPCSPPETQSYYAGGYLGFTAATAVLWAAAVNKRVRHVEVPLVEVVASFDQMIRLWGYDGTELSRDGTQHSRVAPATVFTTRDGSVHLFVSTKHWPVLLEVWKDHPAGYDDPHWRSNDARRKEAEQVNRDVGAFIGRHTTAEITQLMESAGIPCLPVMRPHDLLDDAHLTYREVFAEESLDGRSYRAPRSPVELALDR